MTTTQPVADTNAYTLEHFISAKAAKSISNAYFYRRSLDNELVEVWYNTYERIWTAYVVNNLIDRYQAGPAEFGVKGDIDFLIRAAERRNWL